MVRGPPPHAIELGKGDVESKEGSEVGRWWAFGVCSVPVVFGRGGGGKGVKKQEEIERVYEFDLGWVDRARVGEGEGEKAGKGSVEELAGRLRGVSVEGGEGMVRMLIRENVSFDLDKVCCRVLFFRLPSCCPW